MSKYLDKTGLQDYTTKLTAKYDTRYATHAMVGSPLVAQTAADMTDTDKVYVYTGSETGYTYGDWYYYDGSAWQDGGVYNSAAVVLDTTLTQPDEAAEAKAVGDALANKANIDGSYEDMTVGNAEQLVTNMAETSLAPYNFQTAGGALEIGNRVNLKKVVYGSIVWNQKIDPSKDKTHSGITASHASNGLVSLSGTAENTSTQCFGNTNPVINGHVYFTTFNIVANPNNLPFKVDILNKTTSPLIGDGYGFRIGNESANAQFGIKSMTENASYTGVQFYCNIIDLTLMFGSAIANAIYSAENAKTGDGAAWLFAKFPKLYDGNYAYNVGTLMSSKPSFHKTISRNAYDHTTGKALIIGGQTYRIEGTYTALSFTSDGGMTSAITPDGNGDFSTVTDGVLTVTGGTSTDTVIYIHWDGTTDGEFSEYSEHSYPIDDSIDGHGLFKLSTSNDLSTMYVDGDELEPDGTFTQRYEYRAYASGDESLTDAITDGSHTVVKLTTAVTSQKDPYQLTQVEDNWGTEIFNDKAFDDSTRDVKIMVGSVSEYPINLKDKLEAAPNNPENDGVYNLKINSGEASYVPDNAVIVNCTWSTENSGTTDTAYADIVSAFGSNKNVFAHLPATPATPELLGQITAKAEVEGLVTYHGYLYGFSDSTATLYEIILVESIGNTVFMVNSGTITLGV